ncbi:MAG: hypothetical protein WB441_10545 [Nocardioidaceae bacterium]
MSWTDQTGTTRILPLQAPAAAHTDAQPTSAVCRCGQDLDLGRRRRCCPRCGTMRYVHAA